MKRSEIQGFEFPYFALLHTGYIATNTRHLPYAAPSIGAFVGNSPLGVRQGSRTLSKGQGVPFDNPR